MLRLFSLNKVVLILISGEFLLVTAFGTLVPIFAIFVVEEITAGSAQVVGYAIAIYWIVKSVLQLPVGRWLDKNHGEIDDFWVMIAGNLLGGILAILFFFFAYKVWHIYIFQAMWGFADALLVPPIYAIFSRHLDKGHEGFEWALRSSFSFGAGSAIGGALGGIMAGFFGLRSVFLFTGFGVILGTIVLLFLKPHILPKVKPMSERIFIEQKRL